MTRRAFYFPMIFSAVLWVSCSTSPFPREETGPLRIGFCADLGAAGEGKYALEGVLLELEDVNAAGGLGGRKIELLSMDVARSPAEAVKAYSELAETHKVCAVIGPALPDSCLALGPVAELVKVPIVSHCADDRVTSPEFNPRDPDSPGKVRAFSFLTGPTASRAGLVMAGFAIDELHLSLLAILYDDSDPLALLQKGAFEYYVKKRGKDVVFSQEIESGDSELEGQISVVKKSADGLFVCGSGTKAARAIAKARKNGVFPILQGSDSLGDSARDGVFFPRDFSPEDSRLKRITKRYAGKYGRTPSPNAVHGWDDCVVILEALKRAGSADPKKVRDALEEVSGLMGAVSVITIDPKTHKPTDIQMAIYFREKGLEKIVARRFQLKKLQRNP